ncbi:MAG TPA: ribbon-helix-helix domain-containing protein [Nitrososphaerales archaeon]|nr:ribbon-helix-helix domain-containing protein [Nitrososphaerales archaeon]
MVNLTISLSEETNQKLRKAVKEQFGNRRGALSGLIEESLKQKLDSIEIPHTAQTFKAMKGDRIIAEAENLEALARKLKEANVDPRSVRILSTKRLPPIARIGPRRRVL